jgi:endonuclease G, mitochondrial
MRRRRLLCILACCLLVAGCAPRGNASPAVADAVAREECAAEMPFGEPVAPVPVSLLCRQGYLAGYDRARRLPLWVAERLTPESAWGCGERDAGFRVDRTLPAAERASGTDYAGSGFAIGHMAAAANHLTSDAAERSTFLFSNTVPQLQALNAGLWFRLEVLARVWAWQRGDVLVLSGPAFLDAARTVGPRRMPVPTFFWKVAVDVRTRETVAFLVPHAPLRWAEDPSAYVTALSLVEAATGLRLPRPGGAVLPESATPWPADLKLRDEIRAASCPR